MMEDSIIEHKNMRFEPNKHHRRSIRLPDYNYSRSGAYFITICTQNRECLFGNVADGKMILNEFGYIVKIFRMEIPQHFQHVKLDAYVVMPNHVHGIIIIVGARHAVPLRHAVAQHNAMPIHQSPKYEQFGKPVSCSIPTIIRSFKSAVSKQINQIRKTPGIPVWQRNYYEHILRDKLDLHHIRQYIMDNPINWEKDENYA